AQGAVLETRPTPQVTRRAVDVTVTVRKKDGSLHVNQPVAVTSDPFTWGFAGTHTSSTDTSGNTVVTLYREYPSGTVAAPLRGRLTVALGEVSRTLDVTL
ncbi:MAG TPA: hypothetical protein VEQ60_31515, partial [Longimicrobium sp.]|nr:hypothetical protein [Longimicrobium sp.]